MADYEFWLHVGQAFDQLDKVRKAVKHLAAYIEEKKENAHGVANKTKSHDITKFCVSYCQRVAHRYNHIYDWLLALHGETLTIDRTDPALCLRRIDLKNDLKIVNLKVARELGDRQRSGSWIWWAFKEAMDPAAANENPNAASGRSMKPNDAEKMVSKGRKTKSPDRKTKSTASTEKSHGKMKNTPQLNAKDAAKHKLKQGTSSSDGKQRAQDGPETDGRAYTTWCEPCDNSLGLLTEQSLLTVDRAQGFRAWQEKLRYNEAVNILCAEFRATI